MGDTVIALKALYVALGGNASDVADINLIPDMIQKIAVVAASATKAELPANPTSNGTYNLQAVKSNSGTALSWAAKE